MYAGHRSDASLVVFYPHALVKAAVHIGGGGEFPYIRCCKPFRLQTCTHPKTTSQYLSDSCGG